MNRNWMFIQARIKRTVKPYLFQAGVQPTEIRHGPGKGVRLNMNRMSDLQREFGLHEIENHRTYRHHIGPHSVVYDVGAADGDTALMFANLATRGRVVAFEPSIEECERLVANLALNPSKKSTVTWFRLFVAPKDIVTSIVPESLNEVHTVSLDSLIAHSSIPPPTFVKIDVDGGEVEVLLSMADIMANKRPVILVETHSLHLEQSCEALLAKSGYQTRIIKNAFWRRFYPELRPSGHNRWLLAVPLSAPS
jgi:FkbM family methyltransferase